MEKNMILNRLVFLELSGQPFSMGIAEAAT